MRVTALALACYICMCDGGRSTTSELPQGSSNAELARLLLTFNPATAWQVGSHGLSSAAVARPASSHLARLPSQPQMAADTMVKLKALRDETSAGIGACKSALVEADWDMKKAKEILKAKGILKAEKIAGRKTSEGVIWTYIHHNNKLGVMMEVNCETDFVSKGDEFRKFVNNLCIVAAIDPATTHIRVEDFTPEEIEALRIAERKSEDLEGKPEAVKEKIVEGRVQKMLKNKALLPNVYGPDPTMTVDEYVKSMAAKFGENIKVIRMMKYNLGETSVFGEAEEAGQEEAKPAAEAPKEEAPAPAADTTADSAAAEEAAAAAAAEETAAAEAAAAAEAEAKANAEKEAMMAAWGDDGEAEVATEDAAPAEFQTEVLEWLQSIDKRLDAIEAKL